ncbi:MAG: type II toxin-antitoxin system prevent-host-death family antitoxin [Gemmatimonadetes bacterium]|nr:type II toxin-antitoxin system prevent-host-death family antitoxin [Gemmatimonadota bacterium]
MKSARVSELKASLSKYLARVKAGEELLVTERGRPVAKLVPVPSADQPEPERLRLLERRGLLAIGRGRLPRNFWDLPLPKDPGDSVLKAVLEERESGR